MDTTYNGWKNRQTWNVALWINNDERLYKQAVEYVKARKQYGYKISYYGFIKSAWLSGSRTPDNISYSGTRLDYKALDAMMNELID